VFQIQYTQVAVGIASDRYGRDETTAGCMILAVLGFGLLIWAERTLELVVGISLIGTGLGWSAALLPRFLDSLSSGEQSAGFGLIRSVYGFIGAFG